MSEVTKIVQDVTLTYYQQVVALARLAENSDNTISYNPAYLQAVKDRRLCDLNEGKLPYRPRYIIPDYQILMDKGSKFLDILPPKDIWEATAALQIMYHHVPSITTFPVYLGNLDTLLEPFINDEAEATKAIGLFLKHIDSTLTDSFVHANIGPLDTKAGRIILKLTQQMQLAIPNLSLKYDELITSDEFAKLAGECMLKTAKPSFANNKMYYGDFGEFAIASCYNGFAIGGGGYTLPRMILANQAYDADSVEDYIQRVLPNYIQLQLEYMDQRINYLVEDSAFFKSNFLVKEGFIQQRLFLGMFGVVGLAECCNNLLGITDKAKGFGHNEQCNLLGTRILDVIEDTLILHPAPYSEGNQNRYYLHAQVGIDTDGDDAAPGCRIPIGYEPPFAAQLKHSGHYHRYFRTGIGDVFRFDDTWLNSLDAMLDVIKGAFKNNVRYISGYLADSDVVRVTGYLVKKSEVAKLDNGEAVLNQVTVFGKGARDGAKAFDRSINHEG